MGCLRAILRVVDAVDAIFALIAFVVILVLLASGKIPHDLELWGYGLGGFLLLLAIILGIWGMSGRSQRRR